MRAQAEWNVITHMARTRLPTSSSTRSRISVAALLVNVMARISSARAWPVCTRWAIRCVRTRVLPDPAPARTSSGPSTCVTASRCGSLSPSSRWSRATSAMLCTVMALPDDVRAACREVAAVARHVTIDEEGLEAYAATLGEAPPAPALGGGGDERRAAFSLQLNAINFGSGWFPTLRKAPGMSGFRTVEAGLRAHGPFTAAELAATTVGDIAAVVGQDPEHELMALFAAHLRELGKCVRDEEGGSFLALARSGDGSAERLATRWRAGPAGATSRPTTARTCRSSSA